MIAGWWLACTPWSDVDRNALYEPGDLAHESTVCTGLSDPFAGRGAVVQIGMDTGRLVSLVDLPGALGIHSVNGLALLDDAVVVCRPRLTRIDLATGAIEESDRFCESAADLEGGLVLLYPSGRLSRPLTWYSGWDDAAADTGGVAIDGEPYASRLGRSDVGTLLTAWHSTDTLDVWDDTTGAGLGAIRLDGFDTWTWGVSQVGDRLFVVDDGRGGGRGGAWNVRLAEFDAVGNPVHDLFLGEQQFLRGLSCAAGPDEGPPSDVVIGL